MDMQNIIVESDSKFVVESILTKENGSSYVHNIMVAILDACENLQHVSFSWCPWSANASAHACVH